MMEENPPSFAVLVGIIVLFGLILMVLFGQSSVSDSPDSPFIKDRLPLFFSPAFGDKEDILAYIDLDGDGKHETVFGSTGRIHWDYVGYNLWISPNESKTGRRLVLQFKKPPDRICFTDIDRDGILDLVLGVDGHTHVARGDGSGNFRSPELISTQKRRICIS
ncbi:hypothetical protein A3G55_01715 [Candidatus Giovannonibacteria bacterium RIFCSPLOWO2_12_FULL_44_25]|nr:MAG: hypothetical protein A2120_03550 [Candidatus Giovannonibacteria bacterium GWA2_45_15]OGF59827.1 MAG: hypothetical protein A2W40_01840 [Candidatus Giovannonibacteria bacterium RIFCSPHIGHO2_01_45_12]OGF61035.1 MAG: hypothetical protein A2656_02165 [Candidatus Giovannonibacteria bacterium RIFCSPHIGHO2_01_FULL_44_100]OGF84601.1 MAG: hypothetical protein A3A19_00550 [Candidatus Giovannonibacteria bacterium RIFCSPLOWO2_01_FULL_45_140]OGF88309.1 MAG: hypothetical protein A3I36_01400 [Candidatu